MQHRLTPETPMKVSSRTDRRIVLTANRRVIGVVNLAAAPFVLWLGLRIVADGGTAWFGWSFAGLGLVMACAGVWALCLRQSLMLDRDLDMIRFSLHGPTRRKNMVMALSDLDHVAVRTVERRHHEFSVLDFVAGQESGAETMTIRDFWTARAAETAAAAIQGWLDERS